MDKNHHSNENLCSLLQLDELEDTVLHLLDGLVFSETHSPLVGDVVNATLSLGVLTAGTTDLQVVLGGNFLELGTVGCQLGDLDVHGGADGGAQVGGAEGEEAEAVVVREGHLGLNLVHTRHQATVDLTEVTAHLHGDDAEVVLLIDPHEESLVVVVVDTAAAGPVAAGVSSLQESVSFLEEEVVVDKFLLNFLAHSSQGVECALVFTSELCEGGRYFLFHLLVLGLSQAGVEGVSLHGASTAHTGGDNVFTVGVHINQCVDIAEVLVRVLVCLGESYVVVFNDWVKEGSEETVGFSVRGIYTNTGVQVLYT